MGMGRKPLRKVLSSGGLGTGVGSHYRRSVGHVRSGRRPADDLTAQSFSGSVLGQLDGFDGVAIATPSARHLLHRLVEHLPVLDREVTTHREVVERPGPAWCSPR